MKDPDLQVGSGQRSSGSVTLLTRNFFWSHLVGELTCRVCRPHPAGWPWRRCCPPPSSASAAWPSTQETTAHLVFFWVQQKIKVSEYIMTLLPRVRIFGQFTQKEPRKISCHSTAVLINSEAAVIFFLINVLKMRILNEKLKYPKGAKESRQ